ncbi:hypothetical protein THAOC_13319 [Thalassiosira oceanica]|uniref:Uncharacterized protein n=1 Tax=Thalassiosira oceanica TaxID=159749 RepID=K0SLE9_THAOC|nr:hypothetical protein THAOC_13319 [Thalassiosira oceanica]|eukprot:EJK65789.1 hypothetical protein THAOC_13319 [Thalassiosira oceanica]
MDDDQSDAKRRKVHAPNSRGEVTTRTLDDIHSVLEDHARQIETLASANKVLEDRNSALEERYKALDRKYDALVGKLQAECNSLERSILVLKKGINWRYLAPDVPRSHWIEQGYDEEYADNMDECLRRIKTDAVDIWNGDEDCSCLDCADHEDQLAILYDDALLPHYKELADAIQLSDDIREISIDNVELHPLALRILCPAMEGKVTDIYMSRISFAGPDVVKCYEIIAASIRNNHALERLTWINQISSDDQADLLIKAVIDNHAIKNVGMINCFNLSDANGCRALASLMTSGRPFNWLDFGRNGLSGIDDVAAALATNPLLGTLFLNENHLNDRDADLIAQALKQNTNLKGLYVRSNNLTPAGFKGIGTTIYDPSSLNAMISCNHTCYVDCVENNDNCVGGNYNDMTPQQRRRRKLHKLLSARHAEGSNARHLNAELGEWALTTKLVPAVLRCIEQCSIDRSTDAPTPLSLYFELLKSWKVPELYGQRESI